MREHSNNFTIREFTLLPNAEIQSDPAKGSAGSPQPSPQGVCPPYRADGLNAQVAVCHYPSP